MLSSRCLTSSSVAHNLLLPTPMKCNSQLIKKWRRIDLILLTSKRKKKKIMRLSDQIISFGKSDRTSVFE